MPLQNTQDIEKTQKKKYYTYCVIEIIYRLCQYMTLYDNITLNQIDICYVSIY